MTEVGQVQHTPAPWSFMPDDDMAVGEGGLVRGPQDQWIADVTSIDDQITPAEAKANARLIAAAPELLDALIAMVVLDDQPGEVNALARAAIYKATGVKS